MSENTSKFTAVTRAFHLGMHAHCLRQPSVSSESGAEKQNQGWRGEFAHRLWILLGGYRLLPCLLIRASLCFVIPALAKHTHLLPPSPPTDGWGLGNRKVIQIRGAQVWSLGDHSKLWDQVGEPCGWGHGVRAVKFIKHFGHQPQAMFWAGYKEHEPVQFSPVHTVAIETLHLCPQAFV